MSSAGQVVQSLRLDFLTAQCTPYASTSTARRRGESTLSKTPRKGERELLLVNEYLMSNTGYIRHVVLMWSSLNHSASFTGKAVHVTKTQHSEGNHSESLDRFDRQDGLQRGPVYERRLETAQTLLRYGFRHSSD